MLRVTDACSAEIDAPRSTFALNRIPVKESLNCPEKSKSAFGAAGFASMSMASDGLPAPLAPENVTGPMLKFCTDTVAERCGYGATPTLPSTCTDLPAIVASKTRLAPGVTAWPVASVPPVGANSSDAS